MRMHTPPHPGEIIKSLCLAPLGVTVTEAAKALGISRKTLPAILNEIKGWPRRASNEHRAGPPFTMRLGL